MCWGIQRGLAFRRRRWWWRGDASVCDGLYGVLYSAMLLGVWLTRTGGMDGWMDMVFLAVWFVGGRGRETE